MHELNWDDQLTLINLKHQRMSLQSTVLKVLPNAE